MADFTNTVELIGDELLTKSIIERSIAECADDKIKQIGIYSFYKCTNLTSVNFPAVTNIEDSAFEDCSNLTIINLPLVVSGNSSAFANCSKLTTVVLPSLISVGNSTFMGCSQLAMADFPLMTSIGIYSFSSCSNLTALILRSNIVATMQRVDAFNNTPIASGTGYIYVPSSLLESYKTATNWSTYAAQFRALEDYTIDGTITGELDPTKI